jgi:hypothetical protein
LSNTPNDEPNLARLGLAVSLQPRLRLGEVQTEDPVKQLKPHRALAYGSNPHAFGAEPCPSEVPDLRTSQVGYTVGVRDIPSVQGGERHGAGQIAAVNVAEFGCKVRGEVYQMLQRR